MAQIKQFFSNDYTLFLFCSVLMIVYQLILWKKQKFYNFSKEMANHPLNQKYHLNRKCSADLERINRLLAFSNILAILCSCVILLLLDFKAGIIALTVLFLLFNFLMTEYIGRYYNS